MWRTLHINTLSLDEVQAVINETVSKIRVSRYEKVVAISLLETLDLHSPTPSTLQLAMEKKGFANLGLTFSSG